MRRFTDPVTRRSTGNFRGRVRQIAQTPFRLSDLMLVAHIREDSMKRIAGARCFLPSVAILIFHAAACAPVSSYQSLLPPPTAPLSPPSAAFIAYTHNAGLSVQWVSVTHRCDQARAFILQEIDARERRQMRLQRTLLTIGSAVALGATIYNGVTTKPRKEVTVPLSALTGGALVTAFPALAKDERSSALRDKYNLLNTEQAAAVASIGRLEAIVLQAALLEARAGDATRAPAARDAARDSAYAKYVEAQKPDDELRQSLFHLASYCN